LAVKLAESGPWLPRDVEYYLRSGGFLLAGLVADLVTGLITAYIFANFTSPQTYATFGYVVAVLAVASLGALPGIDAAVLRAVAQGHDAALVAGTRLRLKASFIGAGGMASWAGVLFWAGRDIDALAVAGCSILVPLIYPFATVFAFLQGKRRFAEYARANVLIEVAKTVSVGAAALASAWNGLPVILAPFVVMSLGHWMLNHRYSAGVRGEPGPDFARLGRVLTATACLAVVAGQIDRLLIGTFFAPTAMAAYNLGFTLTFPLRGLGGLVAKLVLPRVIDSDATAPGFRRRYGVGLAMVAILLGLVIAAYWMVFPLIQPLLFPGYEDTTPIVRWLAVATALAAFDLVAIQVLWGLKDLRPLYLTQSVFPIQRVALLAAGGGWFGVPGILAGQVAHYGLCAVAILAIWSRAARRRPKA
jgi:O-antigen/teichoic acid export membrane protein